MDFDIKVGLIGLLLGVLSGLGFANVFNLDFSAAITTTGTFMAGIGAIGTVCIAYKALHSWKEKVAYETLKSSISNAMVLLDRLYLDSTFLRLQTVSLFRVNSEVTSEKYIEHTLTVLEVISKYNFHVLDVELYSKKLNVHPNGIGSLIENRKSSIIRNSLKKVTDLAVYSNKDKSIDEDHLDILVNDLYKTINKEKELMTTVYKGLVNGF